MEALFELQAIIIGVKYCDEFSNSVESLSGDFEFIVKYGFDLVNICFIL